MRQAGFVLAGGRSTRMGSNKAFLPYAGTTLLGYVAAMVGRAAGSVSLIGDADLYGGLGYPVYPDRVAGCGPAGGISTALALRLAPWNLIVACDMPGITEGLLVELLEKANGAAADCIVPVGPEGQAEPLCAVYHIRSLPALEQAIREKRFKMRDLLPELEAMLVDGVDPKCFRNVNTPADWANEEEIG